MRSSSFAALLGLLLPFVAGTAVARAPFEISTDAPASFEDARTEVNVKLPQYLDQAKCGGWDLDQTVEGKIATVEGVPGREHTWSGAIISGMGVRKGTDPPDTGSNPPADDPNFLFPDETKGLTTACDQGKSRETKIVWYDRRPSDGLPGFEYKEFGYPYYQDIPCRWRLKGGATVNPPPYQPGDFEERKNADGQGVQSPAMCENFCAVANEWAYNDCLQVGLIQVGEQLVPICDVWVLRYMCTDLPIQGTESLVPLEGAVGVQAMQNAKQDGRLPICQAGVEHPAREGNAAGCLGQECRCPGNHCAMSNQAKTFLPGGGEFWLSSPREYLSYFRRYFGSYSRDQVRKSGPSDKASNSAPVACFGIYNEFDPKNRQTSYADRRCVINMDVSQMFDSQMGKGTYTQPANPLDPNPQNSTYQRRSDYENKTDYDKEKDVWYENLGRGISFINEKLFKDSYQENLSNVFLDTDNLDTGKQDAIGQVDDRNEGNKSDLLAASNNIRAFDDTGENRTIVSWWQKQQTEIAELLHRPTVRLILPSAWALGIDKNDPIFSQNNTSVVIKADERNDRVEVQIDADEDMLGMILLHIERSLLIRMEEEPIPLVVPLASPIELRAMADSWCAWHIQKTGQNTCENAAQNVKDLMTTLRAYADYVEEIRSLRSELARYAGTLIVFQQEFTKPIGDTVKNAVDGYKKVVEEQLLLIDTINPMWKGMQETMNTFHTTTNYPWCMNQRYTNPILSMLDEWLPTRPAEGSLTNDISDDVSGFATFLPNLTVDRPQDLIIDLSTITYSKNPIAIPVLKPIQLRLDIPRPPAVSAEPDFDPLPKLTPLAGLQEKIRKSAEDLLKKSPPPPAAPSINFPQPMGDEKIADIMRNITAIDDVIKYMNDRYDRFWKSIGPLKPDEEGSEENDSVAMRKARLQCEGWDDQTCQHVEMDLMERFVRIGSRPDIQLEEDYWSVGPSRLSEGACVPGDHVCMSVHGETTTGSLQWDIIGPTEQPEGIETMKQDIRSLSLPQPVGRMSPELLPPFEIGTGDLLPIFDVPDPIPLIPTASGSTSSS